MRFFPPVLLIALGCAAYFNSFWGKFLFDDRLHILGHRRLTSLWPLWEALSRHRPVVDYSLALNHRFCGTEPWGYHLVNVSIHILAALTLFGIVRRSLERFRSAPSLPIGLRATWCRGGRWTAFVITAIWLVHPLQTQSVTYIIQRAESLMSLFYLLTLYFTIRGIGSTCSARWYFAAVMACALGMGSKAVMLTAPVVVLLYDRCWISGSVTRALRARWGLYAGLAATWGVSWGTGIIKGVLNTKSRFAHVGFSYKGVSPVEYALTQFGVVMQYLKLSFWPQPLCLDYSWPASESSWEVLVPGLLIVALVIGAVYAFLRRPLLGFLGVWFFGVLSPTSSFVPIRDPLFEHRMYLALAAVVTLAVIGANIGLSTLAARLNWPGGARRTIAALLAVTVIGTLGVGTVRRNRDYQNEAGMWRDVWDKRPKSSRAAENYGTALLGEGRLADALSVLEHAAAMAPRSATVHNALGFALVAAERLDQAIVSFRKAIQIKPPFSRAHLNLGNALSETGRREEALEHFARAVRIRPAYCEARLNLGNELLGMRRIGEAVEHYRLILRIEPDNASAWGNLGFALLSSSPLDDAAYDESVASLRRAIELNPQSHNACNSLGIALAMKGDLEESLTWFKQALAIKPDFAGAHYNMARCLLEQDDVAGAIQHYATAIRYDPNNVNAHFELGGALERNGNRKGAEDEYRQVLRIKPDHAPARKALDALTNQTGADR